MDATDDAGTARCDHYNRADEALHARFVHHWSVAQDGRAQVLFDKVVNKVPILEGMMTLLYLATEMDIPIFTMVPTACAPGGTCRQDNLHLRVAFPTAEEFATEVADELQTVAHPAAATTASGLEDPEHADDVRPVVRLV